MRVVIVEDELSAQDFLLRLLKSIDPSIEVVGTADSVESAVEWFGANAHPDVAFFDIQLSDGLSFEIFSRVGLKCPVIFTTAFEEYAIRAFKVNSIDYLLKPIDPKQLASALEKYKNLNMGLIAGEYPILSEKIELLMKQLTSGYKERFVVTVGSNLRVVNTAEIQCFLSMEKSTFLVDKNGKLCAIDSSLDKIEELVNPKYFFRIDRKYLINRNHISDIISYSNSRLKVKLSNFVDDDMLVSRKKVTDFKKWLEM